MIDPEVEQPLRKMLGHAIRHELDDLGAVIRVAGDEILARAVPLCGLAVAYIAIDVSERWPTDADLHEIAKHAALSVTRLDITEQEIYEFLSRVALGSDEPDDVFSIEGIATVAVYATANLLLKFGPEDKDWWEYLDQIWDAAEAAARTPLTVLPALMLRARRQRDEIPGRPSST